MKNVIELKNRLVIVRVREESKREGVAIQGNRWDPDRDGNAPYLDFLNVSILVVMLLYGFARCYHAG